jgi:sulfur carrier protein
MSVTMKLNVNDKAVELPVGSSLSVLINGLSLAARTGIAVAVNAQVVPKSEWEKYSLNESDSVMIIQASQGG